MLANESIQLRAHQAAQDLSKLLQASERRIVFAESCTAGLVAATLGRCPGISDCLCGSAVTYRLPTKIAWLDVAEETLKQYTAESIQTTTAMAQGVLAKTPEADLATAVTGHLGPNAPVDIDGKIFVSVSHTQAPNHFQTDARLQSLTRADRQMEAAAIVLEISLQRLQMTIG